MEPTSDGRTVLHRPAAGWLGSLITVLLIGVLTLGSVVSAGVLMVQRSFSLGLVLLALSIWMLSLLIYVWRDLRAKQSWLIEIEGGEMFLDLPPGRSLMADTPREKSRLEVSDVLAIVTRLESFRSFGLSTLQRSYGLLLKSGKLIVLGEDRALATELADQTVGRMIEMIGLRTGLPLRDQGLVEGKGGFLGVLFTSVPGWDTPSLPAAQMARLLRRAGMTFGLAGIVATAGLILSQIF